METLDNLGGMVASYNKCVIGTEIFGIVLCRDFDYINQKRI
jgi:hypothetical protein